MCALLVSICLLADLQLNDQKKKIRPVAIQGKWFISNVSVLWMSMEQRVWEGGSGEEGEVGIEGNEECWKASCFSSNIFCCHETKCGLSLTYCNSSFSLGKTGEQNGTRKKYLTRKENGIAETGGWCGQSEKETTEKRKDGKGIKIKFNLSIWRWKFNCYSMSQIFPLLEKCQALFSVPFFYHWTSSFLLALRDCCSGELGLLLFLKWDIQKGRSIFKLIWREKKKENWWTYGLFINSSRDSQNLLLCKVFPSLIKTYSLPPYSYVDGYHISFSPSPSCVTILPSLSAKQWLEGEPFMPLVILDTACTGTSSVLKGSCLTFHLHEDWQGEDSQPSPVFLVWCSVVFYWSPATSVTVYNDNCFRGRKRETE